MNFRSVMRAAFSSISLLVFCIVGMEANAQISGYVTDQRGLVVKTPFGLCVRTGYWSPAMATVECDPDLIPKKPAPAPAAPRVAPPPPKPRAAPPAPPRRPTPVMEKVTLSADALFDFDKAVIRPDARTSLDGLVNKVRGVKVDTLIVIGHADRIGSDAYNMKLSLRRADAVKGYLVSKGIPANRIYTEGKGERQPATKAGACKGLRDKKLIACLQPDRRVVVEIVGTRSR